MIDTLKFSLPNEVARPIHSAFGTQVLNTKTGVITYGDKPGAFGISHLKSNGDKTTFEISAKVLGEQYPQGINPNTFDRVVDGLNATGLVAIDGANILEHSQVHIVHPSKTVELSHTPKEAIKAIGILNTQKGYRFNSYPNGGVDISRKAKTRNDRFIAYGKLKEISNANNYSFVAQYPELIHAFNPNHLRFEGHLRKAKDIRKHYGIFELNIGNVMSSKETPVVAMWNEIAKDYNKLTGNVIFSHAKGLTQKQRWIALEMYGNDVELTYQVLTDGTKGNTRGLKSALRKECALKLKAEAQEAEREKSEGIIHEIGQRLAEAV